MDKQAFYPITPLTAGEKLYLLVFRARKNKITTKKVAQGLGYHPEYLPYLYKQTKLTMETIHAAARFFKVPPAIFDDDPADSESKALIEELRIMRAELNEARRELDAAHARIKRLEEDKVIRDARAIEKKRRREDREKEDNRHN